MLLGVYTLAFVKLHIGSAENAKPCHHSPLYLVAQTGFERSQQCVDCHLSDIILQLTFTPFRNGHSSLASRGLILGHARVLLDLSLADEGGEVTNIHCIELDWIKFPAPLALRDIPHDGRSVGLHS